MYELFAILAVVSFYRAPFFILKNGARPSSLFVILFLGVELPKIVSREEGRLARCLRRNTLSFSHPSLGRGVGHSSLTISELYSYNGAHCKSFRGGDDRCVYE